MKFTKGTVTIPIKFHQEGSQIIFDEDVVVEDGDQLFYSYDFPEYIVHTIYLVKKGVDEHTSSDKEPG